MDTNKFYKELFGETDEEEMLKEKELVEKGMLNFAERMRDVAKTQEAEQLKRELTGLESYSTTQLKAELRRRKRVRKHA